MPHLPNGEDPYFGEEFLRDLRKILLEIAVSLKEIAADLKKSASSAKGVLMPATIHVNGNGATFVFTEFDGPNGTGNVVPALQPIAYASSAPAVATVDASGNVTAVSAGTAVISGTDPGNSLTASDTLTV